MDIMETELYRVVFKGDCKSLIELTRNNLEILKGITPQKNSALHVAASRGHQKMVELLIKLKPCILLMKNTKDESPLHKAAAAGKLQVVESLLMSNNQLQCDCGSHERIDLEASDRALVCDDVDLVWRSVNKDNETALHYAARGGHVSIAKILLERVKGIEMVDNNAGESALYIACDHGRFEVAKLLNDLSSVGDSRADGRTCLHIAIHTKQEGLALELLHKRGGLAEKANASGNMPLHLATLRRSLPLVRELLRIAPCTSFHVNKDTMAPIHIAARKGYPDIMRLLISATPHCIEVLGQDNKNALHYALEEGHPLRICRCLLQDNLLDAAFLINEPDSKGNTAIHKTTFSSGDLILLRMLKISQWNSNAVNKDGYTALDKLRTLNFNVFAKWRLGGIFHSNKSLEKRKDEKDTKFGKLKTKSSAREKYPAETFSIIAALLATITFAAGFTVPGGVSTEQGIPVWMHSAAFKAFIISNTLAMSCSMLAIFILLGLPCEGLLQLASSSTSYHIISSHAFQVGQGFVCWAFMGAMVSYVTGVYVLVAPKCLWIAVVVCLMGCSIPILCSIYAYGVERTAVKASWKAV